jgi:predicted branched-subunit amino acid permease
VLVKIVRDAAGIGLATGAYGVSFGALAVAAGLSLPQSCALSLLMFTGASQFAFVGLIGGGAGAAVATALLLGARNGLYGLRLASLLGVRGRRRALAAQLVIDESTAMAVGTGGRRGFYATGIAVYACWNLGTLAGALAGAALSDPRALGLDAAAPAAFVALLAPRLDAREPRAVALAAAAAALVAVPVVPAGVPVLIAGAVAATIAATRRPSPAAASSSPAASPSSPRAAEGRA